MLSEAEKENLRTGYKQTLRSIKEKKASKIFLAGDCDEHIKEDVKKEAAKNNISVNIIPTMKELGNICGIEVGASCAVILN